MSDSLFLSLRDGASFTRQAEDQIALQHGSWTSACTGLSPGILRALLQIASRGDYEDRLIDIVLQTDGYEALAQFYYYLHYLSQSRLLWRSVHLNGDRLATLMPISFYFEYPFRSGASRLSAADSLARSYEWRKAASPSIARWPASVIATWTTSLGRLCPRF